ncbi:MAG: patatin-like phospholipase family protein [Planctomycetota bacterium]
MSETVREPWQSKCCDLVMRGGVTSGIVYPKAICRIAEDFTLVGIGGTSAGGIAAAIAAAAEYRRRTDTEEPMAGYDQLAGLPDVLAREHPTTAEPALLSLFRPDALTEDLFATLLGVFERMQKGMRGRDKLKLVWDAFWMYRQKTYMPLLENNYGLCTGMGIGNPPDKSSPEPLTHWLFNKIQRAAGLDNYEPLTFGHLRNAPVPEQLRTLIETPAKDGKSDQPSIELRMVTTCLSYGRPLELPRFPDRDDPEGDQKDPARFWFDPDEWLSYFPKPVVRHLVENAESEAKSNKDAKIGNKMRLPLGDKLPVIVAVRMSLSFPLLFSMVPAFTVPHGESDGALRRAWFSDGGITSNFPVHRFDSLYPRWPTFGINLRYGQSEDEVPDPVEGLPRVSLPPKRESHAFRNLRDFVPEPKDATFTSLFGLLKDGIFTSAQNWHDNSFLQLDIFNDRVAEFWLIGKQEGGLNLNMSGELIRALADKGRGAGEALCQRFGAHQSDASMSWDGHRWARYNATMSGVTKALHALARDTQRHTDQERSLQALMKLARTNDDPYHEESPAVREHMLDAYRELIKYVESQPAGKPTKANESDPNSSNDSRNPRHYPFLKRPKPAAGIGLKVPF